MTGHRRDPPPSEDVLLGHLCEGACRPLQDRCRNGASVGVHPCEPFQQEALGVRGSLGRRKVFDGSADLEEDARLSEMRGGHRGAVRGQVGDASELDVEWFELLRRLEEQWRGVVAVAEHHRHVAAKEQGSGAEEPVKPV